jgi:hypothetical protein
MMANSPRAVRKQCVPLHLHLQRRVRVRVAARSFRAAANKHTHTPVLSIAAADALAAQRPPRTEVADAGAAELCRTGLKLG